MDTEGQIIIDKKTKKLRRKDIIEITELIEKNYDYQNKKLYFSIFIMILMNIGIVFYIYINKNEQKDKVLDKQIKKDFFQKEIKSKILNFEEKINLLESKINSLESNQKEEKNYISKSKNEENINNNELGKLIYNNSDIQGEELPEISYEKFDENIFQEVKKQQMEFCNDQKKYINNYYEKQIKLAKASILDKNFDIYI